jgi:pSer/pThr/pTyr-binding forkhead associated (FHA) protein
VAPPPPVVGIRPRLVVTGTGAEFDLSGKAEILLGREDPVSGVFPEVDLTPHGGEEGGVSRRHAKLTVRGNQWLIEDLNSTNFTFVNNQKLNPGVPQPLNSGDKVRLGRVVLTFQTT